MALDLFESLFAVTAELDRDGIEHALVGGLALAVHGVPRATTDIDLLVRPEDVGRAVEAIKRAGFSFVALPMQFRDGMRLHRISRVEAGETLTVDLIPADEPLAPVWQTRECFAAADGRSVWVVGRDGLIAMKLQAARPQDLADIERLREQDR